ncbi:hypothetical protein [Sphingobium ummariense]|uniref:hypothetical protein n=1 Tax=Sphingobium ummariense TaxID=420994 RepID=UPI0004044206|nr:hypothetical protein [Sphingobium ummariense]
MEKFKRKLFYLGGYDPRGVRFYHQLYREQAERYGALSGETVTVSPRRSAPGSAARWIVENESAGVETDYEFLRWEDLVGRSWIRNPLQLAWRSLFTYAGFLRFLDIPTIRRLKRGTLITLLYPPALALLFPLIGMLLVGGALCLLLPWYVALPVGLAAGILLSGRPLNKLIVPWLLRFFHFNHQLAAKGYDAEFSARIDQFAARIAATLDEPYDEILFVAHSNGSILAASVMNRILALRQGKMPENFALVTLGHCIPLIGCRADARWFHEDLRGVAAQDFRWIDIGSPPDGAVFHLIDPMAIVARESRPRLTLLSPRFHRFYDPATYHSGWGSKYEIHFDYLRVGDVLSPLDYLSLTAGRRTIDEAVALFRTIS